jgi:hypothetical protein
VPDAGQLFEAVRPRLDRRFSAASFFLKAQVFAGSFASQTINGRLYVALAASFGRQEDRYPSAGWSNLLELPR